MSTSAEPAFPAKHPLLADRARLEHITDLMWDEIQRTLFAGRRPPRRQSSSGSERVLIGGTSAEDALQEALVALLRYQSVDEVNWEGLGVTIARRRAIAALRKSRKHRTLPDGTEISVASIDITNDAGDPVVDGLAGAERPEDDALQRVEQLERWRLYRRLATTVLDDREREIVHRVQRGETRRAISMDFGITEQRIGQIHAGALGRLRAAAAAQVPLLKEGSS